VPACSFASRRGFLPSECFFSSVGFHPFSLPGTFSLQVCPSFSRINSLPFFLKQSIVPQCSSVEGSILNKKEFTFPGLFFPLVRYDVPLLPAVFLLYLGSFAVATPCVTRQSPGSVMTKDESRQFIIFYLRWVPPLSKDELDSPCSPCTWGVDPIFFPHPLLVF